jgi:hypothetical protein
VTRLERRLAQVWAATATCLSTRSATASELRCPPRRVGNSGPSGFEPPSATQAESRATLCRVSGMTRSLRPLPSMRVWAGAEDDVTDPQPGEL